MTIPASCNRMDVEIHLKMAKHPAVNTHQNKSVCWCKRKRFTSLQDSRCSGSGNCSEKWQVINNTKGENEKKKTDYSTIDHLVLFLKESQFKQIPSTTNATMRPVGTQVKDLTSNKITLIPECGILLLLSNRTEFTSYARSILFIMLAVPAKLHVKQKALIKYVTQ